MKSFTFRLLVAMLTFAIGIAAASVWYIRRSQNIAEIKTQIPKPENSLPPPPAKVEVKPSSITDSPIRHIDFYNFYYPRLPTGKCSMKVVRLKNGRYEAPEELVPHKLPSVDCWSVDISEINYGDVTGDGAEEAILVLYAELGGTENSNDIFIYTLQNEKPVLLWKFATGDRADGGLHKVYADDGELVIELAGKDKIIGGDLYADDETSNGACCPTVFTRTRYQWNKGRFRQKGKAKILPFTGWQ